MTKVEGLKAEKRQLKGAITRQLNEQVGLLASAAAMNQEVLKKLKKLELLEAFGKD